MSDMPPADGDSAFSAEPLPPFPSIAAPKVTFTAGPDTAKQIGRFYLQYMGKQPLVAAPALGLALVFSIVVVLVGGWGAGVSVFVAFVFLGYLNQRQIAKSAAGFEQHFGEGNFAEGSVSSAVFGAEAMDIALPTMYLRIRYGEITRLEVRDEAVVVRYRAPMFHPLPRELMPDAVLDGLAGLGVVVTGRAAG